MSSGRRNGSLWLFNVVLIAALTACGASTSTAASSPLAAPSAAASPVPSPTTTAAPGACPTALKVGAALGMTVPNPVGIPYGGTLPAGASGIACEYHGSTFNVLIEVLKDIDPSSISQFTAHFPVAAASVPGLGDQAQSFSQALGGGKNNQGVVATKGKTLVDITATATPASLAQIEDLVSQLL